MKLYTIRFSAQRRQELCVCMKTKTRLTKKCLFETILSSWYDDSAESNVKSKVQGLKVLTQIYVKKI